MAEAGLGFPGEFPDPGRGVFLALGKLGADFGWNPVVGGLFDEDPAGVGIAAFGDAAPALLVSTGVFGGDESEEGHQFFRVFEAAEGSNLTRSRLPSAHPSGFGSAFVQNTSRPSVLFGDGDHGGDEFESFEGHEGVDEGFALPVVEELEHGFFKFGDAFVMEVDGGDVVFEDAIVGGIGKGEVAEVAQVGLGPVGLAVVVEAESAEQGEESCLCAAKIIDGIGAGAAEISDGLVHAVGNVDGDEVVGAEVFGEFHGVAFVGFDPVAGFNGNERGRDDFAPDAHLEETSRDPKSASAGFVANVEVGEFPILGFGDLAHDSLKSMLGGGNRSVVSGLGVPAKFEDGDDSFCFMDVESEVECARCA